MTKRALVSGGTGSSGGARRVAEIVMRFTPVTLALATLFATVSSVGISQRPDSQINPISLAWQAKGDAARTAGNVDAANDAYETALAADPRNRAVFVALGDVARQQGLQGKALRYYQGALTLEPTDMAALGGTVRALVDRGAIATARENLSRMKTLCRGECPQIADLNGLVDKAASAPPVDTKNVAAASDPKALTKQP